LFLIVVLLDFDDKCTLPFGDNALGLLEPLHHRRKVGRELVALYPPLLLRHAIDPGQVGRSRPNALCRGGARALLLSQRPCTHVLRGRAAINTLEQLQVRGGGLHELLGILGKVRAV